MAFLVGNRLPWREWHSWTIVLIYFLTPGVVLTHSYESMTAILARVNVSYEEPVTGLIRSVTAEIGRFADNKVGNAEGLLFTGVPENTSVPKAARAGCSLVMDKPPPKVPWIALFIKGSCSDEKKVRNAKALNASAVLLFGNDQETYLQREKKFKDGPIVIYLLYRKGELFWHLVQSGTRVHIAITRGQEVKFRITSINRTSVLFVSVSFIVLMVVSLAWLIFYYIQRFRYINAKDRLARHLNNAAKKALAKIPDRHLKKDDIEIKEKDSCAVCIEPYLQGDTVRILPCKHKFHKACVDPWLLDHRTCPMCKMDILKHYGYAHNPSEENRAEGSVEDGSLAESRRTVPTANTVPETAFITTQVSIISERPVIPCDINQTEQTSSNPVGDIFPITTGTVSSIGSTTSTVIRSMIQSARSRVTPTRPLPPVHSHSVLVSGQLPNDEAASVDKVESGVMNQSENISEEIPILCSLVVSENSSSPILSPEVKSSADMECLVKEIIDFQNGQENPESPRSLAEDNELQDVLPEQLAKREERNAISTSVSYPPTEIFSSTSKKLSAVDCQADVAPSSVQSFVDSNSRRVSLSRFGSSTTTEEDEDQNSKRPSSHIVSITHS